MNRLPSLAGCLDRNKDARVRIRLAQPADAPGIQAVYAPVVVETAVSFETEPPTVTEMAARVDETLPDHPWLVSTCVQSPACSNADAAR